MICKQMENSLIDYLDGTLTQREREVLELHVRSCSSCEERIHGFSEVSHLLDSWKDVEPSASFNARLERRLEQEAASTSWFRALFPRLAALPQGNPVFAIALFVMVSIAAILMGYSPAPLTSPGARKAERFVASGETNVVDPAVFRNLPEIVDVDLQVNLDQLQDWSGTNY